MATSCSIEGCDGTAKTKGWCQAHYMRWWANGDPGTEPIVRRARGRQCSIEGCNRKHQGRGYCETHLRRFIQGGDPGKVEIEPRRPGAACSVEGCGKSIRGGGRGWCNAHYIRWSKTGSPTTPLPDHPPRWTGDAATYAAIHLRLRKTRGRAADQSCVTCGKEARHWSYDHADPAEIRDGRGIPYSLNLSHYQPMCQPCHRRFDVKNMPVVRCSVEGCEHAQKAKSLCSLHYGHARRHRTTVSITVAQPLGSPAQIAEAVASAFERRRGNAS